jgi:KDO2-lipid IV(A) lauroyltransferase
VPAASRSSREAGGDARSALLDATTLLPVRAVRAGLGNLDPDHAVAIGAAMGRTVARLGGPPCETARVNLRVAFPHWRDHERQRVLVESYANLGRGVAELALLQGARREQLLERVSVVGLQHLAAAEAASPTGGVIVLTAHFGSWDLCGAAMASRGHALTVVHHGLRHRGLAAMLSRARQGDRAGDGVFEELEMGRSAVGGVLRALREGRKVTLLLDQNAHRDEGVFVPFFSRLACTRSAPALIAMRRQIPILPAFVFREGEGAAHQLRLQPHLQLEGSEDDVDAALVRNVAAMTRVIERVIQDSPAQWMWPHRRWRTRPTREEAGAECEPVYRSRQGIARQLRHRLLALLRS